MRVVGGKGWEKMAGLSVGENKISYWVRRRDNKITGTDTKMSWTIGCDQETDGK